MIQNTKEKSLQDMATIIKKPAKTPADIIKSLGHNSKIKSKNPGALLSGIIKAIEELQNLKNETSESLSSFSSDEEIIQKINNSSISMLLHPFLRKTFIYLTRHPDLPREKSIELLSNDVQVSAEKIIQLLEFCKLKLEKVR